jgi:hypothetical protein
VLLGHGYAIPTQHSTHILPALQTLRVCLFGQAKRQLPFTLCASCLNLVKNIDLIILVYKIKILNNALLAQIKFIVN